MKTISGKAAELAGIERVAFLLKLEQYQVSPFQVSLEEIEAEAERESTEIQSEEPESLLGLWKHFNIDITSEDIDAVRKEVWQNFPREDIV